MSVSYQIFIKPELKIEQVKDKLENMLSVSFEEDLSYTNPEYRFEGMGLKIYLACDHGFEDDEGIPFAEYPCVIIIDAFTGINMNCDLQLSFAAFLYEWIIQKYKWETMLIENTEKILRRYPPPE